MTTLLLRLAGPLQSWGDSSRFGRRETRPEPTKSGVLGLLAAAEGLRRTDSIEHLLRTRFGVRVDQPGRLVRDFQTARVKGEKNSGLSYRYYLSDAVFVAGIEGEQELLNGIAENLRTPVFPMYLGRRSCPPSRPVLIGLVDDDLETALRSAPWEAAEWYRRTQPVNTHLQLLVDADGADDVDEEVVRDVPISFDSERREYGWRKVARLAPVRLQNELGRAGDDYFAEVSGG